MLMQSRLEKRSKLYKLYMDAGCLDAWMLGLALWLMVHSSSARQASLMLHNSQQAAMNETKEGMSPAWLLHCSNLRSRPA